MASTVEAEKLVRYLIKLMGQWIREKAHGQIVITFRDGEVPIITETRQRQTKNLPE